MDTRVLDACSILLTADISLPVEAQAQAWNKLQGDIKEANRPWMRRRLVLVIVILLLLLATACAILLPWLLSYETDADALRVRVQPNAVVQQASTVDYSDALGPELMLALRGLNFNVLLPSRLPDGFEKTAATAEKYVIDHTMIYAVYNRKDDRLVIRIDKLDSGIGGDMATSIETSEPPYRILSFHGVDVRIFDNVDRWSAQYTIPPYLVGISGDITLDELLTMFDIKEDTLHVEKDIIGDLRPVVGFFSHDLYS